MYTDMDHTQRQIKGVRMRRRLLGVLGVGTAAVMMLSGFDSAMTVADLEKNAVEAMKTVEQFSGDFNAGADITVTVTQEGENGATMSLPLNGELTGSFCMTMEPMAAGMEMQFSGSGAGEEGSGSMQLYVVENEDGTGTGYVHAVSGEDDTGWEASEVSADEMAQMKEAMDQVMSGDIDAFLDQNTAEGSDLDAAQLKELMAKFKEILGEACQLGTEPVEVNGHEAYEVVCDINGEILTKLISEGAAVAGEVLDESVLGMVGTIASSLDILVTSYYDTETYLPLSGNVNLAGSDFSALAQIAASMMGADGVGSIDLAVNRLGSEFNISYDDFGGVVVPEEALSAEVTSGSAVIDSIVTDAGSLFGGSGNTDYSPTEGAVINEDGSYHLEDDNYEGEKLAVDVYAPEGLECSYASESYAAFADENYKTNVSYSLYTYADADEALGYMTDVSYMDGDEDYSDIQVSDVKEVTLDNGNSVKYVTVSYKYQDSLMGSTYAAIPVGDMAAMVEMRLEDENYEPIVPTEEEIITYASAVNTAA